MEEQWAMSMELERKKEPFISNSEIIGSELEGRKDPWIGCIPQFQKFLSGKSGSPSLMKITHRVPPSANERRNLLRPRRKSAQPSGFLSANRHATLVSSYNVVLPAFGYSHVASSILVSSKHIRSTIFFIRLIPRVHSRASLWTVIISSFLNTLVLFQKYRDLQHIEKEQTYCWVPFRKSFGGDNQAKDIWGSVECWTSFQKVLQFLWK